MSIRKFTRLSWAERWLVVQAVFWLTSIKIGLYILRFRTLREILSTVSQKKATSGEPTPETVERVVWAVERSSRDMPDAINCLPKALAAQLMLAQRGLYIEVTIGARRDKDGQLLAHAWIEYQGKVIVGDIPDLSLFSPLKNPEDYKL